MAEFEKRRCLGCSGLAIIKRTDAEWLVKCTKCPIEGLGSPLLSEALENWRTGKTKKLDKPVQAMLE